MPHYRATIRHGSPQTYTVVDVTADSLKAALRQLHDEFPAAAEAGADLLEIRRQAGADERAYAEGQEG